MKARKEQNVVPGCLSIEVELLEFLLFYGNEREDHPKVESVHYQIKHHDLLTQELRKRYSLLFKAV